MAEFDKAYRQYRQRVYRWALRYSAGDTAVAEDLMSLLYDPQTSGGLLIAVGPASAGAAAAALQRAGVRPARIGEARPPVLGVVVKVGP